MSLGFLLCQNKHKTVTVVGDGKEKLMTKGEQIVEEALGKKISLTAIRS